MLPLVALALLRSAENDEGRGAGGEVYGLGRSGSNVCHQIGGTDWRWFRMEGVFLISKNIQLKETCKQTMHIKT